METTFNTINEPDLTIVKEIYDWYIENSTATFHTEPITIDQLMEFIYVNHPVYSSYLIYEGKEVVGFCFLTNFKKRQAYDRTAELTIYLKPEFCNQGIGSIALVYLENKAKENGIKNLIGVISGDNTGSIRLFEKSGFLKCAHYKNVGEKFNKVLDVVSYQKEI
jgi:L-amino acid N-acyltransferase YncA